MQLGEADNRTSIKYRPPHPLISVQGGAREGEPRMAIRRIPKNDDPNSPLLLHLRKFPLHAPSIPLQKSLTYATGIPSHAILFPNRMGAFLPIVQTSDWHHFAKLANPLSSIAHDLVFSIEALSNGLGGFVPTIFNGDE